MIRMFAYTVKPGDTLWSIVVSFGLYPAANAINKIIVANKLWRVPYIIPGQILSISTDGLSYNVKSGDTLWSISKKFNVPINQLISTNNITNPSLLRIGMAIIFPRKAFDPGKYLICIDPGHQRYPDFNTEPIAPGSDIMKQKVSAGTQGVSTGKPEYQLNLEVSLKVESILRLMGYNVLMIRTTNDVNISNAQRAQIANNANATLCVRIHADSSLDKNQNGVSVLYPAQDSPGIAQIIYEKSNLLAEFLLKKILKYTNANSKGLVPRSDLTGFNWSKIPVALVEMGFMSNPTEDVKMSMPSYQYQIAEGISEGVEEYLMINA